MGKVIVINTEDDEKKVIDMIKKAKGKKLLVAIHSLEEDNTPIQFLPKHKNECVTMLQNSATRAAVFEEMELDCFKFLENINQLRLYSEHQNDLKNLSPHGYERTIMFPSPD